MVHLSQAQGEFVLPDHVPDHIVFITGGSGITPAMSMLRSLQRRTHRGRVTFLHYAQSPDHQIFAAELEEIRRSGYGIDVHLLYPEHGDPATSRRRSLERLVPGYRDVDTWACGPAGLIDAVHAGVRRLRQRSASSTSSRRAVSNGTAEGDISFTRAGASRRQLRRHPARAGRGRRAHPGVRLPDGHLLLLHRDQEGGHGPQRADRRDLLPARRRHPHLRELARGRLLRRPVKGPDMTSVIQPSIERPPAKTRTDRCSAPKYTLTAEQLDAFGDEMDAIRQRVVADLGEVDANYIRKVVKYQRGFEVAGRVMFYLPPLWPAAVASLSVSKILDNMEIGHNVMHGQYDWMGDPGLNSRMFEWDTMAPGRELEVRPQLHAPHLHQHRGQGPRRGLRHPPHGRGAGVAALLPGQPGLRVPADDVLRVGRDAARPGDRGAHRRPPHLGRARTAQIARRIGARSRKQVAQGLRRLPAAHRSVLPLAPWPATPSPT